jgi:hypothetical protein
MFGTRLDMIVYFLHLKLWYFNYNDYKLIRT